MFRIALLVLLISAHGAHAAEEISPSTRKQSPGLADQIARLSGQATGVVAFRNVSLFDGTTDGRLQNNMTIVIDGERISTVTQTANDTAHVPTDANVVDGTGWTVVPGLIDSHVHVATLPDRGIAHRHLRRFLYGGITTVRDMAGDARALADLSRAALINEIESPDIKFSALMAGPSFFQDPRTVTSGLGTVAGETPWMQAIDENTDIPLAVARARGTWASGIKIYANLPGQLVQEIIQEGRRQGIPVWTHVKVYPADPFDSVGASSVSHVCMFARHLAELHAEKSGTEPLARLDRFDIEAESFKRYASALAAAGTSLDATIVTQAFTEDTSEPTQGRTRCHEVHVVRPMVAALHRAGVRILAGTDFSQSADDPYPALMDELAALARVDGFSNADAIRAATANAAHALQMAHDMGTIAEGLLANLLFLDDNPLEDIRHLREIVLTVKRGHLYYRRNYDHEPIPDLPFPTTD